MAISMAAVSRRLCHPILVSNPKSSTSQFYRSFFSTNPEAQGEGSAPNSDSHSEFESPTSSASSSSSISESPASKIKPVFKESVLEDGLDVGIYKAIIVGQIGQSPFEKKNKNGTSVVLTSVGTGGMRSERVPFANEEPREFADRSAVQWHRVAVYHPNLGKVLMSEGHPGTIVYLEGNLENRVFSDPITGLVRRIREIAIRRNGRIVFLGSGSDSKPSEAELRGVGYY